MEAEKTTDYQITVCTVNWFSAEFIEALFLNLSKKAKNAEKIQYIVIDNTNGKNQNLERIRRIALPIKIYPNDTKNQRGSFAHAMGLNLAMSKLDTEYTLFVDPDVYVFKDNWDSFCIEKIRAQGCPSIGTSYPKWQLGMYHNFPSPVFCFFRTEDYRKMNADWTAYSQNALINFFNFLRRQILRCCLLITRKKYQRHKFIRRIWTKLEKVIGACSPDTGNRIARRAKQEKIKSILFQAALPDELAKDAGEALKNIAAEFELYSFDGEPILTHKYGTGSWVFRTTKGHDSDYWRKQIQLFEEQQQEKQDTDESAVNY